MRILLPQDTDCVGVHRPSHCRRSLLSVRQRDGAGRARSIGEYDEQPDDQRAKTKG